jgi:hypothetical protein
VKAIRDLQQVNVLEQSLPFGSRQESAMTATILRSLSVFRKNFCSCSHSERVADRYFVPMGDEKEARPIRSEVSRKLRKAG